MLNHVSHIRDKYFGLCVASMHFHLLLIQINQNPMIGNKSVFNQKMKFTSCNYIFQDYKRPNFKYKFRTSK